MDPKLLKKDLDYYLTDRSRRYPKQIYTKEAPTIKPEMPKEQRDSRDIFEEEPNFFGKLHDKLTSFFRKK
jgi:hypothetical protein